MGVLLGRIGSKRMYNIKNAQIGVQTNQDGPQTLSFSIPNWYSVLGHSLGSTLYIGQQILLFMHYIFCSSRKYNIQVYLLLISPKPPPKTFHYQKLFFSSHKLPYKYPFSTDTLKS